MLYQGVANALALSIAVSAAPGHRIVGLVRDQRTGEPLANAVVVLQCSCLAEHRETTTNHTGAYRFAGLPDGTYLVEVFAGEAWVAKKITLGPAR
jgi:hypothetical protein